jgi:hypothetical protein
MVHGLQSQVALSHFGEKFVGALADSAASIPAHGEQQLTISWAKNQVTGVAYTIEPTSCKGVFRHKLLV